MGSQKLDIGGVVKAAADHYRVESRRIVERLATVSVMATRSFRFSLESASTREKAVTLLDIAGIATKPTAHLIYLIVAEGEFDPVKLKKACEQCKAERERACPRINDSTSDVIYVGSSCKPKTRMLEHIGFGAKSTYALQLMHWAFPFRDLIFEVTFVDTGLGQVEAQALEDAISASLKPMFGRRGRK